MCVIITFPNCKLFQDRVGRKTLSYEKLTEDYPRFKDIYDIDTTQLDLDALVDIGTYMNPCPYTVYPETTVGQVFHLFRGMGLRHLPVVSHQGESFYITSFRCTHTNANPSAPKVAFTPHRSTRLRIRIAVNALSCNSLNLT
ncbi:hypothetical protein LOTGIDRAFT_153691 [Lottia gigantea]|uniref:CBS domain-containing protein n=1 Tax=Lottia gigantea TaxID=225164 RepID=V4AD52_LOTGI|nr:hypothetical protein LOTGIDRAFT_153691 [Lottia gigantea]ESO91261.1 hypothetical protein LOTGIDRAFT_153691 [Lottia gigantea]